MAAPGGPGPRSGAAAARRRRGPVGRALLSACAAMGGAAAWRAGGGGPPSCWLGEGGPGRRAALAAAAAAAAATAAGSEKAEAFPNAVRKVQRDLNNPKRPGQQAGDLGMMPRIGYPEGALKECDNSPNCFSTTTSVVDEQYHDIKPWVFKGKTPEQAMTEVKDVLAAYEPGQQDIDGGGFKVFAEGTDFVYVQFESLKRGYIDDVEFAIKPGTKADDQEGEVYLRTSSRQGFYDYGVNGIRLNYIADKLAEKPGWTVDGTDLKKHPRYWQPNCYAGLGRKAPFNTYKKWGEKFCGPEPELPGGNEDGGRAWGDRAR